MLSIIKPVYYIGHFESQIFGFKIARSEVYNIEQAKDATTFAKKEKAHLLIIRCPTIEIATTHYLESSGALLMDTLLRFSLKRNDSNALKYRSNIKISIMNKGEEKIISEIAKKSFRKANTHFYVDEKLDINKCNEFYGLWALNSALSEKNETFVAKERQNIIGFIITTFLNNNTLDGILVGVKKTELNAYYVLKNLILHGIGYGLKKGVKKFEIKTIINNLPMLKICKTLGFELIESRHTFHYWLNR